MAFPKSKRRLKPDSMTKSHFDRSATMSHALTKRKAAVFGCVVQYFTNRGEKRDAWVSAWPPIVAPNEEKAKELGKDWEDDAVMQILH